VLKTLIIIFSIIAYSATASELTIINNGSSTGINSQLLQEYVKNFSDYKVEINNTNSNCATSKILWNNSKKPTLYVLTTNIDGSLDINNHICYMQITKENLLFMNYSAPMELCAVGLKSWNDFTKPGSKHVIGTTATTTKMPEQFLNKLADAYGISIKPIRINTNSEFMTMAKSQELDFGFRTGLSGNDFYKDKCFWNVSQLDNLNHITNMKNLYDLLYEESVILYKNLSDEQVEEFRRKLKESWSSATSIKLRNQRGYDDSLVSYKTEEERLKLFNKFLSKFP